MFSTINYKQAIYRQIIHSDMSREVKESNEKVKFAVSVSSENQWQGKKAIPFQHHHIIIHPLSCLKHKPS